MTIRLCSGCGLRLSIVDTDGICLFCKDSAEVKLILAKGRRPMRKYDANGDPLCHCGAAVAYRGMCSTCASQYSREQRARVSGTMRDGQATAGHTIIRGLR
jgi:hypothetical protein